MLQMHRFFAYEEYGAKYEMLVKDVASTYRTIPQWDIYQKGLEALAASVASINNQKDHSKKSLTVGDLLVKQTPVCDCPVSHMEIERVLVRLRETTAAINRATDDPQTKASLEKTWLLQDRLIFTDQIEAQSKSFVRTLGHIHLCGVLHAVWQTREAVEGRYMISLLYRDYLILASASKAEQTYAVQASIRLDNVRVEEVDNGRAPFSWKLGFECDHQLYEIILSACSSKEQQNWQTHLANRDRREHLELYDQLLLTSLSLGVKPLGTVFGKPGTVARRLSIHRATTLGPKSSLCQVIIKNTNSSKESSSPASTANINRSHSLLMKNRIPVLAPLRNERIKLENLLSDVWTRDQLPFPGMTGRQRSEKLGRASASSVIRKLSVASIASNLTKRSGSLASVTSLHRTPEEDRDTMTTTDSPFADAYEEPVPESNCSDVGTEGSPQPRLSAFPDEPLESVKPTSLRLSSNGSPAGSLARLATLRMKKGWQKEYRREITPPLRASSANSMSRNRTPPTIESPMKGTENQCQHNHSMWKKGVALNSTFSAAGIRNFFR
ncbi:MAG: hypothetical protein M1818_008151 [Claussenomyces sp. TS43310]|nr:MAG: hypothetical protein M1818_008151 [Claussenomyces sp. TS43310]